MTNAQLSPNAQLRLSPRALVSLLAHLTGAFPNPDDAGPVGPWGPIIRRASGQVRWRPGPQPEPWTWAALNPQPLPPRATYALALAGALVDGVDSLQTLAQALPEEMQERVQVHVGSLISRFTDDCGSGVIVIRLPGHGPWPPGDDEPRPIGPEELVVMGAHLAGAGAVHPDFGEAGFRLMGLGLERLA